MRGRQNNFILRNIVDLLQSPKIHDSMHKLCHCYNRIIVLQLSLFILLLILSSLLGYCNVVMIGTCFIFFTLGRFFYLLYVDCHCNLVKCCGLCVTKDAQIQAECPSEKKKKKIVELISY